MALRPEILSESPRPILKDLRALFPSQANMQNDALRSLAEADLTEVRRRRLVAIGAMIDRALSFVRISDDARWLATAERNETLHSVALAAKTLADRLTEPAVRAALREIDGLELFQSKAAEVAGIASQLLGKPGQKPLAAGDVWAASLSAIAPKILRSRPGSSLPDGFVIFAQVVSAMAKRPMSAAAIGKALKARSA